MTSIANVLLLLLMKMNIEKTSAGPLSDFDNGPVFLVNLFSYN